MFEHLTVGRVAVRRLIYITAIRQSLIKFYGQRSGSRWQSTDISFRPEIVVVVFGQMRTTCAQRHIPISTRVSLRRHYFFVSTRINFMLISEMRFQVERRFPLFMLNIHIYYINTT